MNRREFLGVLGAAGLQAQPSPVDFTVRIQPVTVDVAPGKSFKTIGYNGSAPGPLLRMAEGKPVTVEVVNETDVPELVHWHGLHIPSAVDGAMEEGTPMVPARGSRRYSFTPGPAGTRWYHTHTMAGRNLKRASYTGQFGFVYVDPKDEPGRYDQEVFVALREWDPFFSTGGEDEGSMDVAYKYAAMHASGLGRGEPLKVKEGQRVMFRFLNASATMSRSVSLSGHPFHVVAMDGNALPSPVEAQSLAMGPAERIDAYVEMKQPGIWLMGPADEKSRRAGMVLTVEYAGHTGDAKWAAPNAETWDYCRFGGSAEALSVDETVPLVIEKKFAGHNWVDKWAINGKSYPNTSRIRVKAGGRYRLVFDNRSDEDHPLHLHRHTFELTRVEGKATSGVRKDVVVVRAKRKVEVDFVANNPGLTLFHCHQQMHMDYGFMCLMEYL